MRKPYLIRKLLENDFLKHAGTKGVGFLGLRIDLESIEEFKRRYVLSKELAFKYRTIPRFINERLEEAKIAPVENSFPAHCFVYRRQDILCVDLDKKNLNKTATPLISIHDIAEILRLSIDEVALLISNGALKSYARSRNLKDNSLFFTEKGIKNYQRLQINGFNALSTKAAAKFLGIGITAFKYRYVETKKIIPIKLKNKPERIFYRRADVEKLRELELNGIRSPEVAKILKVNISCVNKLTRAGELTPVSGPGIDGFQYNVYIRSEVEALRQKRQSFKENQLKSRKSSRFGRVSGNRYSKIQRAKMLENKRL